MAKGVKTGGRPNLDRVPMKFWVSRALRAKLDRLAAARRVSRSELIRQLLAPALRDTE